MLKVFLSFFMSLSVFMFSMNTVESSELNKNGEGLKQSLSVQLCLGLSHDSDQGPTLRDCDCSHHPEAQTTQNHCHCCHHHSRLLKKNKEGLWRKALSLQKTQPQKIFYKNPSLKAYKKPPRSTLV